MVEIDGLPEGHLHYGYMGVYQVDDIWATTKEGLRPRYKQIESLAGPEWGNRGRLHWYGGQVLKALVEVAQAEKGFRGIWRITDKNTPEQCDSQTDLGIHDIPPLCCHSGAADAADIGKCNAALPRPAHTHSKPMCFLASTMVGINATNRGETQL